MKAQKLLAGILSVSVLSLYPIIGIATNPAIAAADTIADEAIPISARVQRPTYLSFSGTVRGVESRQPAGTEELKYVFVENEEGQEAYFVISEDTYILNEEKLEAGSKVTGFYDATKPIPMIYPPQYPVEVVAVNQQENIKVDTFDQKLVSKDNMLKLNVSADTEIVTVNEDVYEGELKEQKLVVLYGSSTKSIPAQTNPVKVIVLDYTDNKEMTDNPIKDMEAEHLGLIVNGKKTPGPSAYLNNSEILMVPLRAVTQSLNLKISWNNDLQQITVGENIALTIGQDEYIASDSKVISLGTPPELKNGTTFVPFNFFSEVLSGVSVSIGQ